MLKEKSFIRTSKRIFAVVTTQFYDKVRLKGEHNSSFSNIDYVVENAIDVAFMALNLGANLSDIIIL